VHHREMQTEKDFPSTRSMGQVGEKEGVEKQPVAMVVGAAGLTVKRSAMGLPESTPIGSTGSSLFLTLTSMQSSRRAGAM
jgi:hypothetical protein